MAAFQGMSRAAKACAPLSFATISPEKRQIPSESSPSSFIRTISPRESS